MNDRYVIDGHSHFGIDIFHGITSIDGYIEFAKKSKIDAGLIMPVPSPCDILGNIDSRRMRWHYHEGKITYHGMYNPFLELNYQLDDLLKEKSSGELKLFCIPTFHPILDDVKLFEKMIEEIDPVALKLHGIGSGIGPEDIPREFIDVIKKYELPLILHTDCDLGNNKDPSMIWIRNINKAQKWSQFLIYNEIFGTLNHGANLDLDLFKLINETPFVKVALGPSEVSCLDANRLYIDCCGSYKRYLELLRDYLDSSKIIYDADYNWNADLDYDSVVRVIEMFPYSDLDKIFRGNIIEHYKKLSKRIR